MSRRLGFLGALLLAAPAHAAGGEGGDFWHLFWEVANLLLLAAVLIFVARKPIGNFLRSRRGEVEENLRSSENLLRESEAKLAEWTQRADNLEGEVAEIRRIAQQRAEQEAEQILSEARATAGRIERDAESAIEREVLRARQQLRAEAAEIAMELAEQRLRSEITEGDRDRLVDEFVETLRTAPNGRAR